jgi:type I restriction enzyme M protein
MRRQTSIKQHGFLMPLTAIKENNWDLSINRHKEMVHKEVVYDVPKIIINRIYEIEKTRENLMSNLKNTL